VGAAEALEPDLLVVSAMTPELLRPLMPELSRLAGRARVALAGPGAGGIDGGALLALTGDPVLEAGRVSERLPSR
jgi:hypothetical protein